MDLNFQEIAAFALDEWNESSGTDVIKDAPTEDLFGFKPKIPTAEPKKMSASEAAFAQSLAGKSQGEQAQSLLAHDAVYHPNGYDPHRNNCKLRQKLVETQRAMGVPMTEEQATNIGIGKEDFDKGSLSGGEKEQAAENGGEGADPLLVELREMRKNAESLTGEDKTRAEADIQAKCIEYAKKSLGEAEGEAVEGLFNKIKVAGKDMAQKIKDAFATRDDSQMSEAERNVRDAIVTEAESVIGGEGETSGADPTAGAEPENKRWTEEGLRARIDEIRQEIRADGADRTKLLAERADLVKKLDNGEFDPPSLEDYQNKAIAADDKVAEAETALNDAKNALVSASTKDEKEAAEQNVSAAEQALSDAKGAAEEAWYDADHYEETAKPDAAEGGGQEGSESAPIERRIGNKTYVDIAEIEKREGALAALAAAFKAGYHGKEIVTAIDKMSGRWDAINGSMSTDKQKNAVGSLAQAVAQSTVARDFKKKAALEKDPAMKDVYEQCATMAGMANTVAEIQKVFDHLNKNREAVGKSKSAAELNKARVAKENANAEHVAGKTKNESDAEARKKRENQIKAGIVPPDATDEERNAAEANAEKVNSKNRAVAVKMGQADAECLKDYPELQQQAVANAAKVKSDAQKRRDTLKYTAIKAGKTSYVDENGATQALTGEDLDIANQNKALLDAKVVAAEGKESSRLRSEYRKDQQLQMAKDKEKDRKAHQKFQEDMAKAKEAYKRAQDAKKELPDTAANLNPDIMTAIASARDNCKDPLKRGKLDQILTNLKTTRDPSKALTFIKNADETINGRVKKSGTGQRTVTVDDLTPPTKKKYASVDKAAQDKAIGAKLNGKPTTGGLTPQEKSANTAAIDGIMNTLGFGTNVTGVVDGPTYSTYVLAKNPHLDESRLASKIKNIQSSLGRNDGVRVVTQNDGSLALQVPNKTPQQVSFGEIFKSPEWDSAKKSMKLPVILGKDGEGNPMIVDLADELHMLVGGATGQGKSVLMNSIVSSLMAARDAGEIDIDMLDPKALEFTQYENAPHLTRNPCTEPDEMAARIEDFESRMRKQQSALAEAGRKDGRKYSDIWEYNAAHPEAKMKPSVMFIDECADVLNDKRAKAALATVLALGRASGFHVVMATQRPSKEVMSSKALANVESRIAFKTASEGDSETILDNRGAESLVGRGDMIFKSRKGGMKRGQGAYMSDQENADLIGEIEKAHKGNGSGVAPTSASASSATPAPTTPNTAQTQSNPAHSTPASLSRQDLQNLGLELSAKKGYTAPVNGFKFSFDFYKTPNGQYVMDKGYGGYSIRSNSLGKNVTLNADQLKKFVSDGATDPAGYDAK